MTAVAPPQPTRTARPVRVWDVALTITLVVVLLGGTVLASFMGLFLAMASDPCGTAVRCSTGLIGLGVLVATIGPWAIAVAGSVVSIVLLVLRRLAFWVPAAGLVLVVAVWFAGAAITAAGVPTF